MPWQLEVKVTLNHPNSLVTLIENLEYPSKFLFKNFQLDSIWGVPGRERISFCAENSDPTESSAGYQYPRASFNLHLNRKSGYYISNVALPMAVLTYMSVLSAAVEADGSSMGETPMSLSLCSRLWTGAETVEMAERGSRGWTEFGLGPPSVCGVWVDRRWIEGGAHADVSSVVYANRDRRQAERHSHARAYCGN